MAHSSCALWKNLLSCILVGGKGEEGDEGIKKKEILLFFFWIKILVGYVTLENWGKGFQMGSLAQWLHAFSLSKIKCKKVSLMETASYCKNLLKIKVALEVCKTMGYRQMLENTSQ